MSSDRHLSIVLALGTTQTLAWAPSYYLPAILADPIAHDLAVSSNWFFAAFSASLVISGLLGPRVGRQIDLVGGRQVLSASNIILAAGLTLLGASTSVWIMCMAWLLLVVGMGLGLYDAAFGAAGRIYGDNARKAIHWHYIDCRLCQYRRMAAQFARPGDNWMARDLLCLGRRAYPDRTSAQYAVAAEDGNGAADRGSCR